MKKPWRCLIGIHDKHHLTVQLKMGEYWVPREKYWVCDRCGKKHRVW